MSRIVLSTMALFALGACSSAVGDSSSPGTAVSSAAASASTLLNQPSDSRISVNWSSAELNKDKSAVRSTNQDFWFKSRDATEAGEPIRRLRYGKPFKGFHPKRNYTLPITVTDQDGRLIGTGTGTFTGDQVHAGVTTRTITIDDVELDASIFGLFAVEDTGARGEFLDVHAYAGGIDAVNLPATATYTGQFLGDVLSDNSTTATRLDLAANLNVDFSGATVTGTIGDVSAPDINLTGSISGTSMSGTTVVSSTAVGLTNGATGVFAGGFFGDGATNAAGTLGISDSSGLTNSELVGAFGATKD